MNIRRANEKDIPRLIELLEQVRVVVRLNVTGIFPPDFSVLHAYERRVIGLYAAENACMRPPVDGIGIALQRGEVDG